MKYLFATFSLIAMLIAYPVMAQDKSLMLAYQSDLADLFNKTANAPDEEVRTAAATEAIALLEEALSQEKSFHWNWQLPKSVSILTAPDRRFKIFTWPLVLDDGEYRCMGMIQSYNNKTQEYDIYKLTDKSDEIMNAEESMLPPDNWYGVVYQELIVTTHAGNNYYTLIGWSGIDNLVQRKVIEPITFRNETSKPQFGGPLFRKEKNQRRIIFEYSRNAMVNVHYDQQRYTVTENQKEKVNGRQVLVQNNRDQLAQMIIFDEINAMLPGMEGLTQYYVPTGTEKAYIFVDGKWELHDKAQGRVSDPKLDKEFAPLPKKKPAYQQRPVSDKNDKDEQPSKTENNDEEDDE